MENLFGNPYLKDKGSLREHFIVPPFSVLNTTAQDWLRRKYYWLNRMEYNKKDPVTNVFDPVLAEVILTWFSEVKQKILDPFVKDATIGYISGAMKRKFTGLLTDNIIRYASPESQDFIFTVPEYEEKANFFETYEMTLKHMHIVLKKNRFVCIVVKDSNMSYETIRIMQRVGFIYYNEIIVIKSAGALRMRVGQLMNTKRKVGRIHQNVLVFYKGNLDKIRDEFSKL